MRIGVLTREYPPEVYGGAGVHVDHLVSELRQRCQVEVHCFGAPRPDAPHFTVHNHTVTPGLAAANPALQTLSVDLAMADALSGVDLVHSHTWYANLAGHLARTLHGVPHVVTAHSLEPRRPWKAEQLGGGYRVSSWVERTTYEHADAIIAVSDGMRADVLDCYPTVHPERVHVVRNGIDTITYRPVEETEAIHRLGADPARPIVAFVGRITRQKGVGHLLAAAQHIDPGAQLLLCAGAPDTAEIETEIRTAVAALSAARPGVIWVPDMLSTADVRQVLSAATVFACPSVYEPLGIVNLEAMACGTAVVASAVGGIPEVVDDGVTGLLVPYDEQDPEAFQRNLAHRINELLANPDRVTTMGQAGRKRAVTEFSWSAVADRTVHLYHQLLS
ncbi:MAG TPA: glycogen synthase [Pseudonocardiaceae bacterium]|nr:glycogen synthase [Pseudonocardiaceae bacterium]